MTEEHSPVQTTDQAHTAETGGHDEHAPADREWTHDPLERSFFGTVGRGYVIGIIVFGLFAFVMIRTQAKDWGVAPPSAAAAFVAFFAGVLGGVVLIGLWAMKNEELIRGNEAGEPGAGGWVGDSVDDEPVTAPAETAETDGRDRTRPRRREPRPRPTPQRPKPICVRADRGRRRRRHRPRPRRARRRRRDARGRRTTCSRGHRHHLTAG